MSSAEIHALGNEFEDRIRKVLESVLKTLNESRYTEFSTSNTIRTKTPTGEVLSSIKLPRKP